MKNSQTISVKNFGPLNQANINISPLTIFISKNNSGKSFLSRLINIFSNPFRYESGNFYLNSVMKLFENENDFCDTLINYFNLKPTFDDDAFEYPLKDFIYLTKVLVNITLN